MQHAPPRDHRMSRMETPSGIVMATAPVLPVRGTASSAGPKYFRLPDANRAEWTRDAQAVAYPNYRDLSEWSAFRQASVELAERYLPAEMQSALREFFAPHGDPAIVLENLP